MSARYVSRRHQICRLLGYQRYVHDIDTLWTLIHVRFYLFIIVVYLFRVAIVGYVGGQIVGLHIYFHIVRFLLS